MKVLENIAYFNKQTIHDSSKGSLIPNLNVVWIKLSNFNMSKLIEKDTHTAMPVRNGTLTK